MATSYRTSTMVRTTKFRMMAEIRTTSRRTCRTTVHFYVVRDVVQRIVRNFVRHKNALSYDKVQRHRTTVRQISYDAIVLCRTIIRQLVEFHRTFTLILRSYDSLWAVVLLLAFSTIECASLWRP
jgi:hypothetical protein